jgi:WD40 repeat protein
MNEVTIPSSPTWYLSNILACNDEGTSVAYGAKHELVVLKVDNSTKPCAVTPSFIPFAHKDKINAIAFAPSSSNSFKNHLVSCSDDGTVKVWDLSTFTLIYSHSGHPVSTILTVFI